MLRAIPVSVRARTRALMAAGGALEDRSMSSPACACCDARSEEHTSELQSQSNLVCRLLLEKKKKKKRYQQTDKSKLTENDIAHPHHRKLMNYQEPPITNNLITIRHPCLADQSSKINRQQCTLM